jgi:hypothetical protein
MSALVSSWIFHVGTGIFLKFLNRIFRKIPVPIWKFQEDTSADIEVSEDTRADLEVSGRSQCQHGSLRR